MRTGTGSPSIVGWGYDGGSGAITNIPNGHGFLAVAASTFASFALVVPEPATLRIARSGSNIVVAWSAPGVMLQQAPAITGPWQDVSPLATSPYVISVSAVAAFYRLRQ